MILSIIFNNSKISFCFFDSNNSPSLSFFVAWEFGKSINDYFADFDKNIEFLNIDPSSVLQVVCCIEDIKIKNIVIAYFKERLKLFPFCIELEHFSNFVDKTTTSAPAHVLLTAFGAWKKYRNKNIITILCDDVISISLVQDGLFLGYCVFPNFAIIESACLRIKNAPDFVLSAKVDPLNLNFYGAISNGTSGLIAGGIKFHLKSIIRDFIKKDALATEVDLKVIASGYSLSHIPAFVQEIEIVDPDISTIGALEIVKNGSNFY